MSTAPPPPQPLLHAHLRRLIAEAGGWLPFDDFMAAALYAPGLGYYTRGGPIFGAMPGSGSDFVTAPELTPLFGRALARQVVQALSATGVDEVWEFGAGSGALAAQLLQAIDADAGPTALRRYTIVELSGALRARQRERLAPWGDRVQWADTLPAALQAVVIGNEVLDAMPVKLLVCVEGGADARWHERGVMLAQDGQDGQGAQGFAFADRPSALRPPLQATFAAGYLSEIHPQAEAFVRTLAATLRRGAAFFIDYGFPDAEYYHPERHGGTLMCHRAHRMDSDPLADVGDKDITAHVNFSAVALAAQDAGMQVLGYTSQARFLLNCGFDRLLAAADPRSAAAAHKLVAEHEMGELFKVIGLAAARGAFDGAAVDASAFDAVGFARGDRSHRL